jgi:hypothetical protein
MNLTNSQTWKLKGRSNLDGRNVQGRPVMDFRSDRLSSFFLLENKKVFGSVRFV